MLSLSNLIEEHQRIVVDTYDIDDRSKLPSIGFLQSLIVCWKMKNNASFKIFFPEKHKVRPSDLTVLATTYI